MRPGAVADPIGRVERLRRAFRRRRLRFEVVRLFGPRFAPGRRMRASQFAALELRPGALVLLGDSLTEGGLWHEWFPGLPVVNRGIGGDTTTDLLARLETAIREPRAVFLMIGTNDLTRLVPPATIAANVRAILEGIERRAPGTPVVLQAVLPRDPIFAAEVGELNRLLRGLAGDRPGTLEFLDLQPRFADTRGGLRAELTEDGLHLDGAGYAAWADALRPHLERLATVAAPGDRHRGRATR